VAWDFGNQEGEGGRLQLRILFILISFLHEGMTPNRTMSIKLQNTPPHDRARRWRIGGFRRGGK